MDTKVTFGVLILVIALCGAWYYYGGAGMPGKPATQDSVLTPSLLGFTYATSTYGLSVKPEQLPTTSYIPPCDQDFDYCLYRRGDEYKGTNFESAGLRIKKRTDLTTAETCLSTSPVSFATLTSKVHAGEGYATSVFAPIGDAGAGHYSAGALYRLSYGTTCYEIETRIGESQYANYPAGTIQLFTDKDRAAVYAGLFEIMSTMVVGERRMEVAFPALDETN